MKKTSFLARGAIIAAAYAVLTLAFPFMGYGPIQLRISEAMCVLPFVMGEAVWGLTVGCFAANLIGMFIGVTLPWDVVAGTLATFAAAYITSRVRARALAPLPAVIANAVVVGIMLTYVLLPGAEAAPLWFNIITVGLGEAIACYGLGLPLLAFVERLLGGNK